MGKASKRKGRSGSQGESDGDGRIDGREATGQTMIDRVEENVIQLSKHPKLPLYADAAASTACPLPLFFVMTSRP